MDFTTNYCGMYYSDGAIQSSVAHGKSKPVSELDSACQRHDAAYATDRTLASLDAADNKFYEETQGLGLRGKLYGNLVKHGNSLTRHGPMAMLLPILGSLGADAVLAGMLPENTRGQRLRGSQYVEPRLDNSLVTGTSQAYVDPEGLTDDVFGVVYDPTDAPSTSSDGYLPAKGTMYNVRSDDHVDNVNHGKRGYMRPLLDFIRNYELPSPYPQGPIRPYKPLKKKKYAPPKNKLKKKNKVHVQA